MKNIILSILLLIVTISPNLHSQELPVFGITGVNTDEFPLVKSYFVAKNGYLNENYYKGVQDITNPPAFDLKENGISKDDISLELKCAEIAGDLPVHIALVVDASQSMFNDWRNGETRADVLERAVGEFIDSVRFKNGTSLHVIPFSGNKIDPSVWRDWTTTNAEAKAAFDYYRKLVGRTDFNTPMYKDENGRHVLEIFKSRPPTDRKVVVFLTDGAHDNPQGNNPFQRDLIIDELQKRGIEFYSITFAADEFGSINDLRQISEATGGAYYNANSEEELRDIYMQITNSFKSTSVCWLEWLSQLECYKATEREVEVSFTRKQYDPIVRNFTYTPPADKAVAVISRDKDVLYFDNTGAKTQEVRLKAEVGDFHVTGYSITNDNADFSIPEFAAMPAEGFLIKKGQTKKFTINYIKDPSVEGLDFELVFETDLCPVEPVQLIAPCGPTTMAIDFGKVNLSGNTDYTATQVFTNTSTAEMKGKVTLSGANQAEFAIKSVNGVAGSDFTLAAGASMDVVLTITPTVTGTRTAVLNYGIMTDCGVATSAITATVIEADLALASHNWTLNRIGNPVVFNYTIANTNDDAVEIESITLSDNTKGIALGNISQSIGSLDAKVGSTSFDITFTPNVEGSVSVNLQVKLKNREEILTAQLSGTGFVPKISANNIAFPTVEVYNTATPINLVISNTSNLGKMKVGKIYLKSGSAAAFTLDLSGYNTNTEISKGETITVPVNFAPTTVGIANATIIVEADNKSGVEPVTFVLNEFTLSGEGLPGDEINLPLQTVGPILSCESTPFSVVLENNTPSAVNVTGVLSQSGTDFNLVSQSFTIAANSTANATIEYNPSGIGTHTATVKFNYSDGIIVNAPIQGTAIKTNADLINFAQAKYTTPVGLIVNTEFDISLNDLYIRNDIRINRLTITMKYNGRILSLESDKLTTDLGVTPVIDLSKQLVDGVVTMTFDGAIPLDRNLNFKVPFLTLLGNDTLTTIEVSANFEGLNCLTIASENTTSIVTGCNLGGSLISDLTIVDKGFAFKLNGSNPVENKLEVQYELPYANNVFVEIYNISGELIATPKNSQSQFGITDDSYDVSNLPSGVYMLRFTSGTYVSNSKFVKIK